MMRDISILKQAEATLRAEAAERQKMEDKLRASEATLRQVVETSPDCIVIMRAADLHYVLVNDGFSKQMGYAREEALGKTPTELGLSIDAAQELELARRLNEEAVIQSVEVTMRRKDGAAVTHLLSAVLTNIGSEPCLVCISRDIREIKRVEQELIAAREDALAASRSKSEFLSSMSHEIRTPMNAILGMAELLAESDLDQHQQKFLSIMQNNGNALLQLINDILDLAKVESGRLSLEKTGFELDQLVEKAVETLGVRAHAGGLELVARVAPGTPLHLLGDPLRLRQILLNLIGNAIKFTERGEIVLTVDNDRERAEASGLHFTVADTGIGIPPDRLDQVFHNFTQADSSTTRRYGGSGLGLAIVKRLVELMEGRVWAESEVGKGSTFHFTARCGLDLAPRPPRPPLPPEAHALAALRTLVVDDNATNRL